MITPKFPPPPLTAQYKSVFSLLLAVTKDPSANTISTSRILSTVKPNFLVKYPTPPPSASPPTPVVETVPVGIANLNW